jgi:hypothetical protein
MKLRKLLAAWLLCLLLPVLAFGGATLRQEDTPAENNATGGSITSNALPSAALLGSTIEVWLALAANPTVSSVVDSAGQTYTYLCSINDATDGSFIAAYAFFNNQSATALTVTANFTISSSRNIHVREITGTNHGAPAANCPGRIVAPGTAANAISIPLTTSASSGLISGVVAAVSGSGALTAGTGGTGFTGTIGFTAGAGFSHSLFETGVVTGSGANNALWTDSTDGATSTYLGGAVIWVSASTTTQKPQQMMMGVD